MDRIILLPIIRGAYMELLGAPVVLLSDEKEKPALPDLNLKGPQAPWAGHGSASDYTTAMRKSESEIAMQVVDALNVLKGPDGDVPAAVRVPGFGSFYAGFTRDQAEKVRQGGTSRIKPAAPAGRGDTARGRVALITGGAQGFGAEIARGLAEAGAYIVVADINIAGAKTFAEELNRGGFRASAVAVDVSDEDSVRAMAEAAVAEVGGIDLLISNAGVLRAGSVLEMPAGDFEFVTRINYSAFFLVVKHVAPVMIRQRAAAPSFASDIIQINSKSGLEGSNKNGAYAGGKFGGIGLVQSFALELVEYGIKVNAICPGNFFDGPLWSDPVKGLFVQYLKTGKVPGAKSVGDVKKFYEAKVPMGRGCEGPDVLKAILYCIDQAYETGQAIPVTGGQVMLK